MRFTWFEIVWLAAIALLGIQVLPLCIFRLKATWGLLDGRKRVLHGTITIALFIMFLAYVVAFAQSITHKHGV